MARSRPSSINEVFKFSNAFYALNGLGMHGLYGPLHGRASQEVLEWIHKMMVHLGNDFEDGKISEFVWDTVRSGKVVPGEWETFPRGLFVV